MTYAILDLGADIGPRYFEAHDEAETRVFGFWVFLISDLIIFGLMFATYITMANPMGMACGPRPQEAFNLISVFIHQPDDCVVVGRGTNHICAALDFPVPVSKRVETP